MLLSFVDNTDASQLRGNTALVRLGETVLSNALPSGWKGSFPEQYLSAWNESDSGVKLEKTKTATYTLTSPSLDPRVILHTFNVSAAAAQLGVTIKQQDPAAAPPDLAATPKWMDFTTLFEEVARRYVTIDEAEPLAAIDTPNEADIPSCDECGGEAFNVPCEVCRMRF